MTGDLQARAAGPEQGRQAKGLPGRWAALVIGGISALGIGYGAQTGVAAPGAPAGAGGSTLAEVAPGDIPAALETIDAPADQVARFRERQACKQRLAWVSIARAPGQPAGHMRLQSGSYFSPAFELGDVPVRVALPYPAPYETGRGTITVVGTTVGAIVALTPPWHVPAQGGLQAREVTWLAVGGCPGAKG